MSKSAREHAKRTSDAQSPAPKVQRGTSTEHMAITPAAAEPKERGVASSMTEVVAPSTLANELATLRGDGRCRGRHQERLARCAELDRRSLRSRKPTTRRSPRSRRQSSATSLCELADHGEHIKAMDLWRGPGGRARTDALGGSGVERRMRRCGRCAASLRCLQKHPLRCCRRTGD